MWESSGGVGQLCELARIAHMAMKTTEIFQVSEVEANNRSGEQYCLPK